jgi:hypothetical protein
MKPLIFLLLVTSLHFACAHDPEREAKEIEEDIRQLRAYEREDLAELRKLRSDIQKLPAKSAEAAAAQEKIDELQEVLRTLSTGEREHRARLREVRSSPLYLAVTAIKNDKRHPSKSNVSGAWDSPYNIGYVIQLEQKGNSVRGKGYYRGCLGAFHPFVITGYYRAGVLRLTFTESPQKQEQHRYSYTEEAGRPRFHEERIRSDEPMMDLIPFHQLPSSH